MASRLIATLRETTQKNTEQDWLNTNLASFSNMLQGQRNIVSVAQAIVSRLSPLVNAAHAAFFLMERDERDGEQVLNLIASYGFGGAEDRRLVVPVEGDAHRPVRVREEAHPAHARPRGLHLHLERDGRGAPALRGGAAGAVRGRDEGGDRARRVRGVQPEPSPSSIS